MNPYLERVVNWLRAGYPNGVPDNDYQPLLALLRRRLTDTEVEELGDELVRNGMVPADKIDVGVGIIKVTDDLPTEDEIQRVGSRLRESGFPVDVDRVGREQH
ncbi:DUF3349 domain-containing protein [Arsenicicoccus sp. oral taxon 190]|uniref:DUF3349 domain-containing protein n=1 Tax=Arsenicicoccus sp. oral taxon 190 TaxID=1658671 RepID=UPI00067A3795|nr:DUF3349 domain-containing protein [Arsenicicoccus sp. oral taxon 190]AKT50381.1 hypothetical protein ADJ73_01890 [Arsenicicoccus sp. oral taxon 190]